MHPIVEHFLSNKAAYHQSYFAGFVLHQGDQRAADMGINWRKTTAAHELEKMATLGESPFHDLVAAIPQFSKQELEILADKMPSGWPRAKVLEALDPHLPIYLHE